MALVWKSALSASQFGFQQFWEVVGHLHQVPKSPPKRFAFSNKYKMVLLIK